MNWIFRPSIRRKIVGIAIGLIALMIFTSVLSVFMANTVGHLLDELLAKYIPAYGHLARVDIRSLERALALRQMMIARMQNPPDEQAYTARLRMFQSKNAEVEQEAEAARKLIISIIEDPSTPSDNAALGRIETRIEDVTNDFRRHLNDEDAALMRQLEAKNYTEVRNSLARADSLRDEYTQKIDEIRADMLKQVYASTSTIIGKQQQAILISTAVTALAATIGLGFALLVSSGITRPVLRLLQGAREVEAGHLDRPISISTTDEIGQLSAAFNRMVERLRRNEKIRETFGRYFDPKIAEGMTGDSELSATKGQRRVMTVLFCDMKGFTPLSEGVTPQGLVKIINCYLSTMSGPIRKHRGIIDKYIGDAIMAYWGPPFVDEKDQAGLACLAAIDMIDSLETLHKRLPDLLDVRSISLQCDIRIGIATGEVLAGSIGSEFMMSYTVMGDAVNLASRLEAVNKEYGTRALVSEATITAAGSMVEVREIDRLAVVGQTHAQPVFEIMGRKGALTPDQLALRDSYAEGLAAYRAQKWAQARSAVTAALKAVDNDGPSLALLKRIDDFQSKPPPADWDGSWHMERK
ncbi:adenylate/guanylate cyclase domain-containing protein [Bradyrhizobium sp. STM 3562]|uniref:adenylate/guanylate cyclase domain-containing protein n=1 Tax=Bradyrhizobium sp. STM 3562 TaxID=578924 RepID=UPI003890F313